MKYMNKFLNGSIHIKIILLNKFIYILKYKIKNEKNPKHRI